MMRAEFNSRYQVIRTVTQGAVRTHHAFASTGNVVMVHEIDPSAAQEAVLLAGMIARLGDSERERILDVMEVEGTTMIVTRFLLEHETLRGWLEASLSHHGAAGTAETMPVPPPVEESPRAGASPRTGQPSPPSEPPDPKPAPDPNVAREIGAQEGPGEFTRLFRAQPPPAEPPPASPEGSGPEGSGNVPEVEAEGRDPEAEAPGSGQAPRPREAPVDEGPGEFTRMFQAVVAPTSPAPEEEQGTPAPARREETNTEAAGPGRPPSSPTLPTTSGPSVIDTPDPTPQPEVREESRGPGEFTRIFGAQNPGPSHPTPAEPPVRGGYPLNRDDEYRSRLGPTPASTPLPPTPSPPHSPDAQEDPGPGPLDLPRPPSAPPPPGEYTRIIQAMDRPTPGPTAVPGAPPGHPSQPGSAPAHPGGNPPHQPGGYPPLPGALQTPGYPPPPQPGATQGPYGVPSGPPPSPGPSRTLVIVGLVAIVVLAVALILFFALAGGDPAAVPAEAASEVAG
jgi:hypothetical protein